MKANIHIRGKNLKYVSEVQSPVLSGEVIIYLKTKETSVEPREEVFKTLQALFEEKCRQLKGSIDQIGVMMKEKARKKTNTKILSIKSVISKSKKLKRAAADHHDKELMRLSQSFHTLQRQQMTHVSTLN